MFGWEFSPLIAGGLGVVCRDLSSYLADQGTQITYVLPRIPSKVNLALKGISFQNAEVDKIRSNQIRMIGIDSILPGPYYTFEEFHKTIFENHEVVEDISQTGADKKLYGQNFMNEIETYASRAGKYATDDDYDIIHNHDWMTAKAAINAKKASGKPMIMHVHSTEIERTIGFPNQYIYDTEKEGMMFADKIVAVSQLTKDRIVANYGIDPDKIEVVHNAIAQVEAKYGPIAKSIHKDDQIVLFLARLTAMKGANYLLQAAQKVIKVMPKTKFLFVGDGELLETLVEMSVELGISHKVTFTGFLTHDQVDKAYSKADVFVMPSIAEPFGLTPLEAIRNGTPVILSKQSGVSEVLQNVLKVDFWDTDEMANKLIAVLKHGVLSEELSNNSKRDLENLNWDTQSRKVMDLYNKLKQQYSFSKSAE